MSSEEDFSSFDLAPENGEKLDDDCCETYAGVIWSHPFFIKNDINCVDIRKISKEMIENRDLHGKIAVNVSVNVGCLQAVYEEKYVGRVFATGSM